MGKIKKYSLIQRAALLALLFVCLVPLSSLAQTIQLTGTVTDTKGETLIGASVLEKGTTNGCITDIDGNFALTVATNATMVISYVGYVAQEIPLNGQKVLKVTLKDDTEMLDEVMVIAYGTTKKESFTGSAEVIKSEKLKERPVANVTKALDGMVAGVQTTSGSGQPGSGSSVVVRGYGSINSSQSPLYVVDGVPYDGNISAINPNDIETMTVLKDASAGALYGSRGANGVILVTTKSGKEGKLSVSYNAYYSWKKMAKTLNTLSATDYVKWQREYALLRDNESKFTSLFGNWQDADLYENAPTNDWQDQVFGRTGNTFNHNLTISGANAVDEHHKNRKNHFLPL